MFVDVDKIGSATSPLHAEKRIRTVEANEQPRAGDVLAVRALTESATYGNIELPSGRLAKINRGDILLGVLGKRRALKGFVGDVPASVATGDRLHLLNMGGVIGECKGHHSSLTDAIELEVIGIASDEIGLPLNIGDYSIDLDNELKTTTPIIVVAGSCMNSGKTVAAVELIRQAANAGLKVAGVKLTGIACLRDTLNMQDHGAFVTASFIDCGLPSTVDCEDLSSIAKSLFNHIGSFEPDLIVAELGDGIIGGYGVDQILADAEIKDAISSLVFCASDYVGVVGGVSTLRSMGIEIDVVAGSVTDSQMGEDFVRTNFGLEAGNARRDGKRLFDIVRTSVKSEAATA
ncbi:MAG: hypothetical protein DMF63_12925 [Acidobacteria bacterium]|nr:MAG: hypothetical protein DMF63_12925 [Acidobacteriota bacterium]